MSERPRPISTDFMLYERNEPSRYLLLLSYNLFFGY